MDRKGDARFSRSWKRLLLVAFFATALCGCWGGGFTHTHPHLDSDGKARTHRHWHASTGKVGHHDHPHLNQQHKKLAWSD
ncbi:MAG: hypothetical protein ACYTHM_03000 [Planctomycetota bacterium]|jgi:hypothetical protein